MKRTTYIFIAGTLLFIAAFFIYNNIENSRAIIRQQQAEKEKVFTPFTLKNGNNLYDDMEELTLTRSYRRWNINCRHEGYCSDTIWIGEHKGDSSSFFKFQLKGANQEKDVVFLNDGEAILYDAGTDSLITASELNHRLFAFQQAAEKFEANNAYKINLYDSFSSINTAALEYLETRIIQSYPHVEEFKYQIATFCNANKDNVLPAYVLAKYGYLFSTEEARPFHDPEAVYSKHRLLSNWPQSLCYGKGTPFTDIDLYTLEGKKVKLSQWVGKGHYTLVALDSGTDDQDMVFMKDAYARYHQTHGLEIVHIYTGKRYLNWKLLVNNQNMPWVKLSALYYTYKVYGAYARGNNQPEVIMLFDPEGKMVDHNISDFRIRLLLQNAYGE